MHLYGILVVALLCTAGLAQEEDKDDPRYLRGLEICQEAYPEATKMEVYYSQLDYMCMVFCWGSNEDDDFIGGMEYKDSGTSCANFYTSKVQSQCLEGTCVPTADVDICKNEAADVGDLKGMSVDECSMTCIGDTEKDVKKPEDSPCTPKNRIYQPGKCTKDGMCSEERTYVSDPNGGSTANQDMLEAVKSERRQDISDENKYCYVTDFVNVDYCEFVCYYVDNDVWDYEILTTLDGYSCGADDGSQHCLGGKCTSETYQTKCQGILNDDLKRVEIDGCEMECKGAHIHNYTNLDEGSKCITLVDGWYANEGTCVDSVCEIPESSSEEEYGDSYTEEEYDDSYTEEEYDDSNTEEEYDDSDTEEEK